MSGLSVSFLVCCHLSLWGVPWMAILLLSEHLSHWTVTLDYQSISPTAASTHPLLLSVNPSSKLSPLLKACVVMHPHYVRPHWIQHPSQQNKMCNTAAKTTIPAVRNAPSPQEPPVMRSMHKRNVPRLFHSNFLKLKNGHQCTPSLI